MNRLILLILITLIAGCVKPPIEGRLDPYDTHQIHFASDDLRKSTAVKTPTVSRDEEGNILYVTVPIRAATDKQLHVDYRVTFFDKNGQVLNETAWFTRTLEANIPSNITVNSLGPRAADFQVDFRYAQ